MFAFYERQSREALARHESRAAKQLQEALLAQRAGVAFDRSQFNQHREATGQLIVTEFHNNVQRLRMLVWQHRQQRQQILLQQQHQRQRHQHQLRDQQSEQSQ